MNQMFKCVQVSEQSFLYPFPVIKGSKYLIQVPDNFANFYAQALTHGFLQSPLDSVSYYQKEGLHTDGKTPLFSFNRPKLTFTLLQASAENHDKKKSIEKILNTKILAVLAGKPNSKAELEHRYAQQKKCSTCQQLGIGHPHLEKLIHNLSLIDV